MSAIPGRRLSALSHLAAWVALLAALLVNSGCASLLAEVDPPGVTVERVQAVPEGGETGPRFQITLRVTNPNKQALDIAGISYSVDVLDHELVTGVTNQVPRIEPYSEQTVDLEAGVNLLQFLRLLADLGLQQSSQLDYRFVAKIDFKGLVPTQRVEETGSLSLN